MNDNKKVMGIYAVLAVMILALVTVNAFPRQTWHLLLVLAIGLMVWGLRGLAKYRALQGWTPVRARLLAFEEVADKVSTSELTSMPYYHPRVRYEYETGGKTRQCEQVSLEKRNIWVPEQDKQGEMIPASRRPWHGWSVGAEVDAYVNPANADEAVLLRDIHAARYSHYRSFVVTGIIAAMLWLVLLVLLRS